MSNKWLQTSRLRMEKVMAKVEMYYAMEGGWQ